MKERLSSQSSVERNSASHSRSRAESDSESLSSSSEFETPQQSPKKTQIQSTINSYNNGRANLMKKFTAENPDLQKVDVNNYISDSDEICLVEMPASIDPNLLLNKNINFEGKSKLKLGKAKYIVEPRAEPAKSLLILDGRLNFTRPVSSLVLRKKLKDKAGGSIEQPEQTSVPFPENLKVRHPLFGPEYEKSLVLNEETKQKLNGTFEYSSDSIKSKSKKKKHREKTVKEEVKSDNEVVQEDFIQNLLQDCIDKKSRKKKPSIAETPVRNKIKHENSFVNSTIIPNRKMPTFDLDISNITQDNNNTKNVVVNGEAPGKKKSKKVKEQQSKKRKLSSGALESNDISTPKKKKKTDDAETDKLIKDILHSVRKKITKKS